MSWPESALLKYLDELYRWNDHVNLTRVPRNEAWARHIEESRLLLGAMQPQHGASVVDVGSGGGIPGIPIAVLAPHVVVTLVESDARKAAFLGHMLGLLGLTNGTVVNDRAETIGQRPEHRERHDLAVSRATAAPDVLCELALPLVRVGGCLVALVGEANTACKQAQRAARVCGGGDPEVAGSGLMQISKESTTPTHVPRRAGVPRHH